MSGIIQSFCLDIFLPWFVFISLVRRKCQDPAKVKLQQLLRSNSSWVNPVHTWARSPTKSTPVNIKCITLTPTPQSAPPLVGEWTNITKINAAQFCLCYLGERGRRYSRNRGTLSGPSLRLNPLLSVRSRSYTGRGPPRPMPYRAEPSRNSRCGGSSMEDDV